MINFENKAALWREAMADMADYVSFEDFIQIEKRAYVDRIRGRVIYIVLQSESWLNWFNKKWVKPLLESVFKNLISPLIKVELILGPRRVKELAEWVDFKKEKQLLEVHGDIIGVVEAHPAFKKAAKPIENGGFGIWPRLLTKICKEFGLMTVLQGLHIVANKPSIRKPRAFFLNALRNGQFGQKLGLMEAAR